MTEPELRPLPPARRHGHPSWAVYLDGERIGEIRAKKLPTSSRLFYDAIVKHPRTGKPLSLELDPSLDNRVRLIAEFHRDPMTAKQHWR